MSLKIKEMTSKKKQSSASNVEEGSLSGLVASDDGLASILSGSLDNIQSDGFFHKVQRPKKPYKRAHFVAVSGRDNLEAVLLNSKDKANPDLNFVMKLGMHLLVGNFNFMCTKVGCMLVEFAYNRGVDFTPKEQKAAAKGHLDTFLHEGLYGEQYHLRRAKELYSNLITGVLEGKDGYGLKKDMLIQARKEYCFVLQGLNDGKLLGEEARAVADILVDIGDIGMEVFCLLSGSGYKEHIDHDEAANSFFQIVNEGIRMPGELSRVEVLFIITRNLNQLEGRKAALEAREYEHDYKMIHLQGVQDKSIPEEVSYEEWLNDFNTWEIVADKCAALGVFGVAADLYGQGLTRDARRYRDSMVWWKLGKFYYRCGRIGDARSSVAQSLAIEEWKPQYQKVASWWWRDPNMFEEATHTWSIRKILSLLPPIQTMELPSHRRLKQILPIARAKWQERLRREAELEAIRKLNEAKEAALREGLAVDTGRRKPKKDRNKKTPKIVWKTPLPILYPSKLTPKECNATCKDMEGEFEYFPGTDSAPLPAGEHRVECEFTPKNTDRFNCELASVVLIVKKAKPLIKWRNPVPLYVGSPLTEEQHLNAKLITVAGAADDGGDDKGKIKGNKKRRKQSTMDFATSDRGNAEQLVDPPAGTMEYYLEDVNVPLPPEDADNRILNDEYYARQAGLEESKEEKEKKAVKWYKLFPGDSSLTQGSHRVLMVFTPTDRVNYLETRTFASITVMPKVVPKVVWERPEAPLMFQTPLSKVELSARGLKVTGKFKYYHVLTQEDLSEPKYLAELEEQKKQFREAKREREEVALMAEEDVDVEVILEAVDQFGAEGGLGEGVVVVVVGDAGVGGGGGDHDGKGREGAETPASFDESKADTADSSERPDESPLAMFGLKDATATAKKKKKKKKKKKEEEKDGGGKAKKGDDESTVAGGLSMGSSYAIIPQLAESEDQLEAVIDARKGRRRIKAGYVLPAGVNKLLAVFTPRDDIMYDQNSVFIDVNVVKAQPELVWGDRDTGEMEAAAYSDELLSIEKHLNARLSTDMDDGGAGVFTYQVETVEILPLEGEEGEGEDEDNGPTALLGKRVAVPREPEEEGYRVVPPNRRPTGITRERLGLLPKGRHRISVHYSPLDKRNHEEARRTLLFTVRCRPRIHWDENYVKVVRDGVPISAEGQLRASVSECPGVIEYTPAEGEVLEIGQYQLKASFYPQDDSIHDVTHKFVPFQVVRKLVPKVEWTVEPIDYGQAVDTERICSATADVEGEFSYNIGLGQVLDAGSYSVVATFRPEDSVTYATTTAVNQLVVMPLQTRVAFVPEAGPQSLMLTYGDPLREDLFCAVEQFPSEDDVPSHFAVKKYSLEEGAYLPSGDHVLRVSYEVQEPYSRNYRDCEAEVTVTVFKYSPKLVWPAPNPVVFGTGSLSDRQLCARLKYDYIVPSWMEPEEDDEDEEDEEDEGEGSETATQLQTQIDTVGLAESSLMGFTAGGFTQGGFTAAEGEGEEYPAGLGAPMMLGLGQGSLDPSLETWGASATEMYGYPHSLSPGYPGGAGSVSLESSGLQIQRGTSVEGSVDNTSVGSPAHTPVPGFTPGVGSPAGNMHLVSMSPGALNQGLTNELSQVSLGIYTDYGSTIAGMGDSMSEAGGPVGDMGVSEEKTQGDLPLGAVEQQGQGHGQPSVLEMDGPVRIADLEAASIASSTDGDGDSAENDGFSAGDGLLDALGVGTESLADMTRSVHMPYLEEGEGREDEESQRARHTEALAVPAMPEPPREAQILRRGIISASGALEAQTFIDALRGVKVTGRIRYTPGRHHVLQGAGIYPLRAVFVPDDGVNVGSAEITVNITVLRARPVVTWKQPQPMFAGTALSKLQLCAAVACPGLEQSDGIVEYFPNRGEVLPVGMHVLRCRWVPHKYAAKNFDCKHSWAEVPLLVKPKPFNMTYLDNLAPPKTGVIGRKLPPGDSGFVDTTKGRDNWVSGMPFPGEGGGGGHSEQARAKTAGSAARGKGHGQGMGMGTSALLGLNPPSRPGTHQERGRLRQSGRQIATAPSANDRGGGTPLYRREDEHAISPRTQRDMAVLQGNILSKQQERVRTAGALIGMDVNSRHTSSDLLDGDYIEAMGQGKRDKGRGKAAASNSKRGVRPSTTSAMPTTDRAGGPGSVSSSVAGRSIDAPFYTQDAEGNHVQIDSFGRVMAIDIDTIGQYAGEESSEYDHTLYKQMEQAGTFTGGIPAKTRTQAQTHTMQGAGSQASISTGAHEWADGGSAAAASASQLSSENKESDSYLLRNLTPHQYKSGKNVSKDRLFQLRSSQGSRGGEGHSATEEGAAGPEGLDSSWAEGSGTLGGEFGFGSVFGDSQQTYAGTVGIGGRSGGDDFVPVAAPTSAHGYPGYGYSRSPSPEQGTHTHGSVSPSGAHFSSEEMGLGERPRKKKKKKGKKGGYVMSDSLALGTAYSTRKPQTAPEGTLTRRRDKEGAEDPVAILTMPQMHFGTGNTGKHTAKRDMDSSRKVPATRPFKWNYYVDVRNVFEGDSSKAKVAGEKAAKAKKNLREERFLPLQAPPGMKFARDGVDTEIDEAKARRQLVKLERQINSLRRDALGVARMVQYTEKIREDEASRKQQSKSKSRHRRSRSPQRAVTAEASSVGRSRGGTVQDYEDMSVGSEGSLEDPSAAALKGLERVPGIGTGAARRIASSYEYEHPYMDLTMPTGVWDTTPKPHYASSTAASDRLTDTAKPSKVGKTHTVAGSAVNILRSPVKRPKSTL